MSKRNVAMVLLTLALAGCGSGMSKSQLQESQSAAEKAAELEKSESYAEALALVESAISGGGLNPDQLADAYLLRSRCHSMTGKLEEAQRDIEAAEQGAPNPARFHFSRAILFLKQNKAAESKAEFTKASRIDPSLKMPR